MGGVSNSVNFDVLDMTITSKLTDIVCMCALGTYGKFDVTEEEFAMMLDGGLRDSIVTEIKTYYESWGNISVEITDEEYYTKLMQAICAAV